MTKDKALALAKSRPGIIGIRHKAMNKGWYAYWADDKNGGYSYHVNPVTGSRPLFPVEERKDWEAFEWSVKTQKMEPINV